LNAVARLSFVLTFFFYLGYHRLSLSVSQATKMKYILAWFLVISSLFAASETITHLQIQGTISPASSSYLKEGIASAQRQKAVMVLVELDTPGGLSTSMREMIQNIVNSPIPVAVFVAPKGARAASAGTYLLYAAHVAAMAPGTNLGAATPISLIPPVKSRDRNISTASVAEKKALNDAMAYIKSLAQLNERNATWALKAVEEAESLSAEDALRYGVIDLIAQNRDDLLARLDGRTVRLGNKNVTLVTAGARITPFEADWKTRFLAIITNPNIAYMLLLVAIYGIFFELMNPGTFFPGVIGMISGVVALYALNLLPFNYAGLLLILLGIAFMIAEVFVAGFGILGIGGAIAFAIGSFLLFDAQTLGSGVSIPLIIAFTLVSLAFFLLILRFLVRARHEKVVTGAEELVGASAEVIEATGKKFRVRCHGEIWQAESDSALEVGQHVRVERIEGLTLHVIPPKE
jgi:membrane-bound serine protease (ClpP class)